MREGGRIIINNNLDFESRNKRTERKLWEGKQEEDVVYFFLGSFLWTEVGEPARPKFFKCCIETTGIAVYFSTQWKYKKNFRYTTYVNLIDGLTDKGPSY